MNRHPTRRTMAHLASYLGHPLAIIALALLAGFWIFADPEFAWHEAAVVLTLLATIIIQASHNRDFAALHAKLDELIAATPEARDQMQHVEDEDEAEIERTRK